MEHIVAHEDWATVDLDVARKHVFVREDWEYTWRIQRGQTSWTHSEKVAFHSFVDRSVWVGWSHRALIQARPDKFATRSPADQLRWNLGEAALKLSFDVKQVRANGHWQVTVWKVDPKIFPKPQAKVDCVMKTVVLYSTDLLVTKAKRFMEDVPQHGFNVHAHEFGHTLANKDEYRSTHVNFDDIGSVMNVGRQLRARHLDLVCDTLARMVPKCSFVPVVISQR